MPENCNSIGKWLSIRSPAWPSQPGDADSDQAPASHHQALNTGTGTASVLPSVRTDETDAAVAATGNDAAAITAVAATTSETGAGTRNLTLTVGSR